MEFTKPEILNMINFPPRDKIVLNLVCRPIRTFMYLPSLTDLHQLPQLVEELWTRYDDNKQAEILNLCARGLKSTEDVEADMEAAIAAAAHQVVNGDSNNNANGGDYDEEDMMNDMMQFEAEDKWGRDLGVDGDGGGDDD